MCIGKHATVVGMDGSEKCFETFVELGSQEPTNL
jgi:hypothetical protein